MVTRRDFMTGAGGAVAGVLLPAEPVMKSLPGTPWNSGAFARITPYVCASNAPKGILQAAKRIRETMRPKWVSLYGDYIRVCDGTADDVDIQAANNLDAGLMQLSPGTFQLAAAVLPIADSDLRGSGMFQSILVPQSALQGAVQVNTANVSLRDFGINGNNISVSGVRCSYTADASRCFIDRLYVYNLSTADVGVAIQFFDVNQGHVKDCVLLCSNGQGILASYGCWDIQITGNYIFDNKDNAIEMAGNHATSYPKRILVAHNIIDGQADATGRGIVVAENAEHITIAHNLVNGASYGIDLSTTVASRTMKYIRLHGNKVWNSYSYDIRVYTDQNASEDVTITENECLTSAKEYSETGSHTRLVVARNKGIVTENSGASTGTGAQQTIAHGLVFTPTRQQIALFAGSATAAPYHSADPDATNIYVTAANLQAWYWATVGR